jgi:hypothetical protein
MAPWLRPQDVLSTQIARRLGSAQAHERLQEPRHGAPERRLLAGAWRAAAAQPWLVAQE